MVKINYQNYQNDIDAKDRVNPLSDYEPVTSVTNEAVIKIENDKLESGVPDHVYMSHFHQSSMIQKDKWMISKKELSYWPM